MYYPEYVQLTLIELKFCGFIFNDTLNNTNFTKSSHNFFEVCVKKKKIRIILIFHVYQYMNICRFYLSSNFAGSLMKWYFFFFLARVTKMILHVFWKTNVAFLELMCQETTIQDYFNFLYVLLHEFFEICAPDSVWAQILWVH